MTKMARRGAVALAFAGTALIGGHGVAQAYPPVTEDQDIDVSASGPTCEDGDAVIDYSITGPAQTPATITFVDADGATIAAVDVDALSGQVDFPGEGIAAVTVEDSNDATGSVTFAPQSASCTATLGESPDEPSDDGATLPQTGGPGTTQILLIAGAAVAAGVAVTGIAARRRDDGLDAA